MSGTTINRSWVWVEGHCLAIDAIDAFRTAGDGITMVHMRGGHIFNLPVSVFEFQRLLESTNVPV